MALKNATRTAKMRFGEEFETEHLRVYLGNLGIRITDLTNAGRRGKKVDYLYLPWMDSGRPPEYIWDLIDNLHRANFATAKRLASVIARAEGLELYENDYRGVDVTPAGFKPVKMETPEVSIQSDYQKFIISDKLDIYNRDTCIPALKGGKASIKVFYKWVQDNESSIRRMTFNQILSEMEDAGIKFHRFCGMD